MPVSFEKNNKVSMSDLWDMNEIIAENKYYHYSNIPPSHKVVWLSDGQWHHRECYFLDEAVEFRNYLLAERIPASIITLYKEDKE